jgi:tryptophan synthase alpha chain
MSRIDKRFALLKKQGRKALIPFITAGDPAPWITVPLMHGLVEAGADLIELGVPFSDPMADGTIIQQASERALQSDTTLQVVLEMVKIFRTKDQDTPVVLMGYLNPVEAVGYAAFAAQAAKAGVDGVLTVDAPPEESDELTEALREHGLDPIFLLAPTSRSERIRLIVKSARGFIYYVALRGVTGAANLDMQEVENRLNDIRTLTDLPVGVGFGISGPDAAARVARFADAVVVGSALVRRIGDLSQHPERIVGEASAFVHSLRTAIDGAHEAPVAAKGAR